MFYAKNYTSYNVSRVFLTGGLFFTVRFKFAGGKRFFLNNSKTNQDIGTNVPVSCSASKELSENIYGYMLSSKKVFGPSPENFLSPAVYWFGTSEGPATLPREFRRRSARRSGGSA